MTEDTESPYPLFLRFENMKDIKILYEDKYLIICEKPVGVQSQKGKESERDMLSLLEEYRKSKGEDRYIGLVHRLDTATGGAMIFSKTLDITGKLSALISSDCYKKAYLAVVHGEPCEKSGELRDLLYHDKIKNKSYVCDKERKGVKEAIATYSLLETVRLPEDKVFSLVIVTLVTGRTHQIRVQFASRKMALVGDGKYGSRDNKCSCALWSHMLEITHPVTNEKIEAKSFPESIYPWNCFDWFNKI